MATFSSWIWFFCFFTQIYEKDMWTVQWNLSSSYHPNMSIFLFDDTSYKAVVLASRPAQSYLRIGINRRENARSNQNISILLEITRAHQTGADQQSASMLVITLFAVALDSSLEFRSAGYSWGLSYTLFLCYLLRFPALKRYVSLMLRDG